MAHETIIVFSEIWTADTPAEQIRARRSAGIMIRQLLTESVILALGGAAAGTLVAMGGLESIRRLGSSVFPRVAEARVDAATLVFTTVVGIVTGLLFGVAPALQSTRTDGRLSLEEGGRRATAGSKH